LLTVTAIRALERIANGKPAFPTMLIQVRKGSRRELVRSGRRRALDDLYRRLYIRPTPSGPVVTELGRRALREMQRIADAGAHRGIEIAYDAAAERWGGNRKSIGKRVSRIREYFRHDAV
jgi:hypothetical protein